ncbi:helix-turn-helix domain-containing protein [Streptomyces mirabilis]
MVEGRRHEARGGARKREAGAGARYRLVFVDRLVATLIHLRHDVPHAALGLLFGVDRSTITRAIGGIRGLPAERGRAVPDRPGLRLRTWRMCSHTPGPRASSCGWMPPRSRSAGPRPAAAGAVRSSRARRNRTR